MEDLGNDAVGKETTRLWRAWRTVHEMVADRVSCAPHYPFRRTARTCHAVELACAVSRRPSWRRGEGVIHTRERERMKHD